MNYNQVQISNSPSNGKARIVDVNGIVIRPDLKSITLLTSRKFYDVIVDGGSTGYTELSGVDYAPFEWNIVANNSRLCNPDNGLRAYPTTGDTYQDMLGNVIANPVGFYDYFQPMLLQPVATMDIAKSFVVLEDNVYHSYD